MCEEKSTVFPSSLISSHIVEEVERVADYVDRKSTRLNSSHDQISYAVFCLKKKKKKNLKIYTTMNERVKASNNHTPSRQHGSIPTKQKLEHRRPSRQSRSTIYVHTH